MNNSISAFSGNNLLRLNGASEKIQHLLQLKMANSLVLSSHQFSYECFAHANRLCPGTF